MSALPEVDPWDVPYRLKDIIPLAYPNGGMTLPGLRREVARGNLVVEMVAGKQFVTMRAIEEMREKCRVKAKGPDSGSGRRGSTGGRHGPPNGSSSTGQNRSPQDALKARLARRKDSLRATSKTSGAPAVASDP